MENPHWMAPLAEELWSRDVSLDSGSGNLQGFHFQANSTSTIINELKFAAAKSIRSSVVILASFNVVVAFATAAGIFWESYVATKRHDPKWRLRRSGFSCIGPAESFPFILSCGIMVQGIVFAVSQSKGLEALLILGCTLTSQFMLPAIFITPFIQLVFGLELTIRALKPRPFPSRGKWNITICMVLVCLCLLTTFVITLFIRPSNFCFASLFWFVQRYKVGCFGLLVAIVSSLLIGGIVIFIKLRKNMRIDITERIAASRMVYFLAVAAVSNALLIPFFFNLSFSDPVSAGPETLELSLVASVVSNLSGLITGGLYLFLRSSTITTIGPKDKTDIDAQELKGSPAGASINDFSYQINQPVSPPNRLQRTKSNESLLGEGRDEEQMIDSPKDILAFERPNPLALNGITSSVEPPQKPEPAQFATASTPKTFVRKSNYNLFPNNEDDDQTKSIYILPTTTYTPPSSSPVMETDLEASLLPPPVIHGPGHRRESSLISTATVQIGLRLSNVDDMSPLTSSYLRNSNRIHDLGCPNQPRFTGSKRPSPLASTEPNNSEDDLLYTARPYSAVPRDAFGRDEDDAQDLTITLAPAVYSPNKPPVKVTSPNGVGFGSHESSRGRANSWASQDGPRVKRADWI